MNVKEKLGDRIVNQIRADITSGTYKINEKIPAEPELMKLYGVGRSTIREAIKTLATSGILIVQQGFGTIVNSAVSEQTIDQRLKNADFDEINVVRKLLETEIVKLAVENHSIAHIDEIERCLENRRLAILSEHHNACIEADIAFHMSIARASLNTVLADLYQSFTLTIRDFFSKREVKGVSHFAMSHHLHEALYKTIRAQKIKQAQTIIKEILDNNY
ncbi:FadR/GntR family transcriptional regulator [Mucilaginibacter sp. L196]|uniref:FadR/GntR family transcriptional regulator n=1 Tax=Mucilaginibacter sp. L196 TaxID=1641870 RepID=UPI00131BA5F0|nr:FCD domain-containing protein [Mucilaginibacter sp. L196]